MSTTSTVSPGITATYNGLPQQRRLVTSVPGPRSEQMQALKAEHVSAGVGVALPVFIAKAGGGVLIDVDGNSLIDMGSGIAVTTVGNANPDVTQAVQDQVAAFTHTCFMVTPYQGYVDVCRTLNELTPGDHPKRSALFSSGAEAIENAVKIARAYTKRTAVVVVEHGYHGRTNLTMAMTAKNMPYKQSFGPFAPEVYRVPVSYPFRDQGLTGPEVAEIATSRIDKEIGAGNVAAIIMEPILGEGGFVVPGAGYATAMAQYARANHILFIADEIQSGFCRTGDWFASAHEGVIPDLITTAKGIAGGLPLSAVTGRAEVMDAVHAGGLGGTYAGSPAACAAALASIGWMAANDANSLAREIGDAMRARLADMATRYPAIGDIRGRGAMMAIELIVPGTTRPDADLVGALNRYCHAHGVVTLTAGTYGNVFRFLPPLTMPLPLLHEAFDVLEQAFAANTP